MATFDQLSAEQRAIVELVLQRGKDYDELSDMLGVPETRVRELARDALVDLAPVSAGRVEEDWRGQLADYVLGQQSGPEATATRGHLRRSEAARTWTRSLLDSLDQLYRNGSMPAIPEGERGVRPKRVDAAGAPGRLASADVLHRRRGLAVGGVLAAVVLVAVLLWPVGLVTGGGDDGGGGSGQASPASGRPKSAAGIAVVFGQGKQRVVEVVATGLQPTTRKFAYQLWLYNDPNHVKSLGAQVTDKKGTFKATGPLPSGFENYRYFDLSREAIGGPKEHSGDSILRGAMPRLAQVQGNKVTRLGQVYLSPPTA